MTKVPRVLTQAAVTVEMYGIPPTGLLSRVGLVHPVQLLTNFCLTIALVKALKLVSCSSP